MKKEDVSGVIVYLLILVLAVVFGLTVLKEHQAGSWFSMNSSFILFIILSIFVGLIFNSIIFELAHIAGAKVGGYKVLSTSILGLTWYKTQENKTKFKLGSYDGLTGETRILPDFENKKHKEPNPAAYLWFGTLFYVVEIISVIVAFVLLNNKAASITDIDQKGIIGDIAYFLLIVGVIGFMILIYNILPFKLDSTTDGYRMTLVANPKNKIAFNELLRVEHEIEIGNNDVEIKTFDEITNFTADLNLNKVYLLLDKKNFDEAESLLDMIINSKSTVSEKVYLRAKAQKIYINLMNKSIEESREFYNKYVGVSESRELSNDTSMASIRAYLLISGLLDKSRSECFIAINRVKKAFKATPKNRQATELMLFNEAIMKVDEAHPDWELKDYQIDESVLAKKK